MDRRHSEDNGSNDLPIVVGLVTSKHIIKENRLVSSLSNVDTEVMFRRLTSPMILLSYSIQYNQIQHVSIDMKLVLYFKTDQNYLNKFKFNVRHIAYIVIE